MRVRRTPSIQAHVTNRVDHPLLIAADAASAVAHGFRELETTVPILRDSPANALALLVGSQVAGAGSLTQCSVEEATELELGMRGLTTYAETVSVYGTEQVFVDGDDTPVVEGVPRVLLRLARAEDALHLRLRRRGADGRLRGQVDAVPRGSLHRGHPRCGRSGRPERRHRRRQRHRVRPGRDARGDRREPLRDDARPRVMHRQRHADVVFGHPPYCAHAAAPARRLGLPLLRVRLDPRLRQRVRAVELQRRGPRRLPRRPARLGLRGRAARPRRRRAAASPPPGRRGVRAPCSRSSALPPSPTRTSMRV